MGHPTLKFLRLPPEHHEAANQQADTQFLISADTSVTISFRPDGQASAYLDLIGVGFNPVNSPLNEPPHQVVGDCVHVVRPDTIFPADRLDSGNLAGVGQIS